MLLQILICVLSVFLSFSTRTDEGQRYYFGMEIQRLLGVLFRSQRVSLSN